jgi:hypothetical protein
MGHATQLLIGTRKGAWILKSGAERKDWTLEGPLGRSSTISSPILAVAGRC